MNINIEDSWKSALAAEFDKDYFIKLMKFINDEYAADKTIYPAVDNIYNAFNLCPFDNVRVVIIGQDPYHDVGQAHGLCFSVPDGIKLPPSLKNIYREIENDLGRKSTTNGDLTAWAKQGVLLLNSVLTVRAHAAASHAGRGWEQFTDAAIQALETRKNIVYLLWGGYAQKKAAFVNASENLVLKSAHPSPLSAYRGFFDNQHFSKTNEYLHGCGYDSINW